VLLWRISNFCDLSGMGAEMESGRWHTATPGKRMVYLCEHPAVALIENLANLDGDPRFFRQTFQLLKVSAADAAHTLELSPVQISVIDSDDLDSTQAIGDGWLASRGSALLRVPSIPSPESWNYLLNPLHPDATLLTLEWARHIAYDKRLFRLTDA
jgi:RES domain-containing protein